MRRLARAGWRSAAIAGALLAFVAGWRSARGDDHASALALLPALEADTTHQVWTRDAIRASRGALERATRLRVAGDEGHARLAEGLALEWAETARDLARAADAERREREVEVLAIDAGARVEREQALLEEAIARSGRLATELTALQKGATHHTERTAATSASSPAKPSDADAPASSASVPTKPAPPPRGAPR